MTQLNEAINRKDFSRAAAVIHKYLKSKLGKVYFFPSPEVFSTSGRHGVGIKFFVKGDQAIRLNWINAAVGSSLGLKSVDFWDGSTKSTPTKHIEFDVNQSLAKVLPFIVEFLNGGVSDSGVYVTESIEMVHMPIVESFSAVNEATYTSGELSKTITNTLNAFTQGIQIADQYKNGGNKTYGPRWNATVDAIKKEYSSLFTKEGAKVVIDKANVKKIDPQKILSIISGGDDAVSFQVTAGTKEEITVEGTDETDIERMSYEDQLDSLKSGMKLMMANATNSMWVAGRGGTGKTQTIEDMLHAAGKTDGEGYFKITGSATPAGIYRLLHTHRKEILLFDDSDSALNDQEGRNLFKAAADTKKVRKVSWMKGGKNYVDPADYDDEGENDELPRYFDFTGKIIFISNMPLQKLDPDGALRTRGFVMNVDPFDYEMVEFMRKIVDKIQLDVDYPLNTKKRNEVVDIIAQKAKGKDSKTLNLRMMVRGLNVRAGIESQGGTEEEWKKFIKVYA